MKRLAAVLRQPRDLLAPLVLSSAGLAWLLLWLWERAPWGRYLHQGSLCGFVPTEGWTDALAQGGLYAGGWVLMTTAMMLPSTLPLLAAFRRLTGQRADRDRLLGLVVGGYLGVWLGYGLLAHFADTLLHVLLRQSALLQLNLWVLGAIPLLLAGLFQFSSLKHRCLDRCRAPVGFVLEHWRGGPPARQALALGAHHGLFCVGCCWALMLLMFAVGSGNFAWMLALGAVMAVEKNLPWGTRLSAPLGIVLIAWAAGIALQQGLGWL